MSEKHFKFNASKSEGRGKMPRKPMIDKEEIASPKKLSKKKKRKKEKPVKVKGVVRCFIHSFKNYFLKA